MGSEMCIRDSNVTSDDNIVNTNWTVEAGGTLNMEAGELRNGLDIAGEVNISGGGTGLSNTGQYDVESGGVLNVSGGILGSSSLNIQSGGVMNHSGGDLGFNTDVEDGGVLNISGGTVGADQFATGDIDVDAGGTVNFRGNEFFIDGAAIAGLTAGGPPVVIAAADRGVLTGTLLDNSPVGSNLINAAEGINLTAGGGDNFNAASIITVSIPLVGDINGDGLVSFADLSGFLALLT